LFDGNSAQREAGSPCAWDHARSLRWDGARAFDMKTPYFFDGVDPVVRTPGRTTRGNRRVRLAPEGLELRLALSSVPSVAMVSATTMDSKSVTIDYTVSSQKPLTSPLQFGVYRSATDQFGPGASLVAQITVSPDSARALDSAGRSLFAPGVHQATFSLPAGLPPYPEKPYVLVVADPGSPLATSDPTETAAFRVYTIGVVTHGGIQNPSWKYGPPWQLQIADMMKHEAFDSVIAYNWALASSTPGAAIQQSPRLARDILHSASKFPAGSIIDLVIIGHSEGTVVNAYALARLKNEMPPGLRAGYIVDTLLDPHAANDHVPGQQYSTAGILGGLANALISNYQAKANDPPAFVPSFVDQALVFYQHNKATPGGIYNLWGQVPVVSHGPLIHYFNLSAAGATHSGNTGVNLWYRDYVAPSLGYQTPLIQDLMLNAQIINAAPIAVVHHEPVQTVTQNEPGFSGTATPGAEVRLYLGPAHRPTVLGLAGLTHANTAGRWSLTPRRPLRPGTYRAVVASFSRALRTRPGLTVVPTQPLGMVVVKR